MVHKFKPLELSPDHAQTTAIFFKGFIIGSLRMYDGGVSTTAKQTFWNK
jgi:hypothetical protein